MLSDTLNEFERALVAVETAKAALDATLAAKAAALQKAVDALTKARMLHDATAISVTAEFGTKIEADQAAYQKVSETAQALSEQVNARMAALLPDSFRGRVRVG